MSYIDISKVEFDNNPIRSFIITHIDNIEVEIYDVQLTFQKNRAIVFNIITNCTYIDKNIKSIKGKYYDYTFYATIDSITNKGGFSSLTKEFDIVINLLEFSKKDLFFTTSNKKWNINIIPTKNMLNLIDRETTKFQYNDSKRLEETLKNNNINKINYAQDKNFIKNKNAICHLDSYIIDDYIVDINLLNRNHKMINLLKFTNLTYEEYNNKIRYLLELYSFLFETPILINKIFVNNTDTNNILFQSQNINENILDKLDTNYLPKSHTFELDIFKYLNNFVSLKKSQTTLDLLLKIYFVSNIYEGKDNYNLNDISGLIDLFDGVFIDLKIQLENIKDSRNKRDTLSKNKMEVKIDYILEKIEPALKNYVIGKDESLSTILANFRNNIRHPNEKFKEHNLEKIFTFSKGTLRIYIIKYILHIDKEDYDIAKILSDFKIFRLFKHKYLYKNEVINIFNIHNYQDKNLTPNNMYYERLLQITQFKDTKPDEFVYQNSEEIRKMHIEDSDKIKFNLRIWGVISYNNEIVSSDYFEIKDYKELKEILKLQ